MRFLLLIFCLISVSAYAETGFSGYAQTGAVYFNTNNNMTASGKSNDIDAGRFSEVKPLILGEIKYTTDSGSTFHIGMPKYSLAKELSAGWENTFSDSSKLDISAVSSVFGKTWENPYADNRSTTKESDYGLKLDYSHILNTGFFTGFKISKHKVDDDAAGELFSSLRRDGTETSFKAGYETKANPKLIFFAEGGKFNADGDAESYDFYSAGTSMFKRLKSGNDLLFAVILKSENYNQANPYFGLTRYDTNITTAGTYTINGIFGRKDMFTSVSAGYIRNLSNISFFEYSSYFTGVSAGINF